MAESSSELTSVERAALALGRFTNERPAAKRLQMRFLRNISQRWVRQSIQRRVYIHGVESSIAMAPDRGVIMASNHRSFFDQYIIMLSMFDSGVDWVERIYFPVRANFFYERPLGLFVNAAVGGMVMYPPIFRDSSRSEYNKDALDRVVQFLQEPGTLVGIHPEGTRGKGPDPYEMLPAQPGIGQIVLRAKPVVLPIFINGITNDFVGEVRLTYQKEIRRERPIIIVVGEPVDYSEFTQAKPRTALYKRCADKIRADILALQDTERELRDACLRGDIDDDHPGWVANRMRNRRRNGAR